VEVAEPAGAALARLLAPESVPFRTRFLLVGPSAELSAVHPGAREAFRRALSADPDARVRAEAARSAHGAAGLHTTELLQCLDDADVRVREAAAGALRAGGAEAAPSLARLLRQDPWPLVRGTAVRSLAALGHDADGAAAGALATAVTDPSAPVRVAALSGLGARGVVAEAPRIRERLVDREESPAVRAAAAAALGVLCDASSVDVLTERALRLGSPGADEEEQGDLRTALSAHARIRPADIERRLAPLRGDTQPPAIRRLAAAAVAPRASCSRPRGGS
jgi:HEAT repeat protein